MHSAAVYRRQWHNFASSACAALVTPSKLFCWIVCMLRAASVLTLCYRRREHHRAHANWMYALEIKTENFSKCSTIFSIAREFHLHLNKHTASQSRTSESCLNSSTISFNTLQINVVRHIFVRCALLNDAESQVSSAFCRCIRNTVHRLRVCHCRTATSIRSTDTSEQLCPYTEFGVGT